MHLNTDSDNFDSGESAVSTRLHASSSIRDHCALIRHHGLDNGLSKGYEPVAIVGMGE